ncbi:DrmB family protein [Streptomyces sp. NPDC055099]
MTSTSRPGDGDSRFARLARPAAPRRRGSARRSQVITTYGVGSMIAIESESFIVRGIDSWHVPEEFGLTEPRLQHALRVDGFHLPPASADSHPRTDGVHIARFPRWYSCPKCKVLAEHAKLKADRNSNKCSGDACGLAELTPSRFVAVCENGHLDDFPYWKWVHKGTGPSSSGTRHELTLHATGRTAALRSIEVHCSCGKKQSMEGALGRAALESLGIKCSGARPWLKGADAEDCLAKTRAIQRGSSTAWFPQVASALTIPPWSEGANKVIRPYVSSLLGRGDEFILEYVDATTPLRKSGYEAADLLAALRIAQRSMEKKDADENDAAVVSEDPIRRDEYEQLQRATRPDPHGVKPDFECLEAGELDKVTKDLGIEQVMLVPRLREVRAMTAFTRLDPPNRAAPEKMASLAKNPQGWLPAIEVIGEGVFFRLSSEQVKTWEERAAVAERAESVLKHHQALLAKQAGPDGTPDESPVSARLLLLHTLAHVLINEWSLDSGYPAASLRERLYVDDDMLGVLIYTATSDSAGSLGGLVKQGEPASFAASLDAALARSSWCSADPLCIESTVSGADNVNIAACHCCVLLPETSCESFNRFLDRVMLIGTPANPELGLFNTHS